MASVAANTTIKQYQEFVNVVYRMPNDRNFGTWDMISNLERFSMRALKGIRKDDPDKTRINLLIAFSWFTSINNQLHIDMEKEVWSRFPSLCSYCGASPCRCKESKTKTRQAVKPINGNKPVTMQDFQQMFQAIYPAENRTLEQAGIHLAEELGEFSEALMAYRGNHSDANFRSIMLESADLLSCFMGVFNSLGFSAAGELSAVFSENCHICKKSPCECSFESVMSFES